jgi:NADH:ubiquinone oxidoreductase subunit F (NADH-binding)
VAALAQTFSVARHPRLVRGLLLDDALSVEVADAYRLRGGYGPGAEGAALIEAIAAAGLRGRGGAAFPAATKLAAVAERPGPRVAVANGAEGEPTSVKDRFLLHYRPHLVLDGLVRAARAVGAERSIVYVADAASARSVRAAIEAAGVPVDVVEVAPGYVAGEETALVRAVDGGEAKPVLKPPRPFEAGVGGRPTAVLNVETLANAALIAIGAHGDAPAHAETLLLTLSGAVNRPGLYEVPLGITLGEAVDEMGGGLAGPIAGVLAGGYFGGVLNPRALDLSLDHDSFRAAGSGLGCGAIVVLAEDECPLGAAAEVMAFLAAENARQCGPCFRGTESLRDGLAALAAGTATEATTAQLERLMPMMRGRGVCATPDAAVALVASLDREFPGLIAGHMDGTCARCVAAVPDLDSRGARFAIPLSDEGEVI